MYYISLMVISPHFIHPVACGISNLVLHEIKWVAGRTVRIEEQLRPLHCVIVGGGWVAPEKLLERIEKCSWSRNLNTKNVELFVLFSLPCTPRSSYYYHHNNYNLQLNLCWVAWRRSFVSPRTKHEHEICMEINRRTGRICLGFA